MPATAAIRIEDELLDADVGQILRLELNPVAVQLDRVVEVRCDEVRRRDAGPRLSESNGRERSHHHNSASRGSPLPFLRTKYTQDARLLEIYPRGAGIRSIMAPCDVCANRERR